MGICRLQCIAVLVGCFAVEGKWLPTGPWTVPELRCTIKYGSWVESHSALYSQGCIEEVPSGAAAVASDITSAECVGECFDYFFEREDAPALPLGSLNVTAFVTSSPHNGSACFCSATPVISGPQSDRCPVNVFLVPTGCLYETKIACTEAPSDGCVYTLDDCCIDANGYDWDQFTQLFPWWACGVAAVLLLLTSLLVWVVRSRVRQFQSAYSSGGDELEDKNIEKLKDEYAELLKKLHANDKDHQEEEKKKKQEQKNQEGGEVPVPDDSEPTEHTSLVPKSSDSDGQDGSCPVCLEELNETSCVRLQCGHRLRLACMQQYVQHSLSRSKIPGCPICRAKVMVPSLKEGANPRSMSTILPGSR